MLHLLPILGFACLLAPTPPTPEVGEPSTLVALEKTESAAPETAAPETAALDTSSRAGLRVIRDPVTGRIVSDPTDAELARLAEGSAVESRRSAWELKGFSLPNGGTGVVLDGWADHALAVEVTADGKLREVCSQGDSHPRTTLLREENDR